MDIALSGMPEKMRGVPAKEWKQYRNVLIDDLERTGCELLAKHGLATNRVRAWLVRDQSDYLMGNQVSVVVNFKSLPGGFDIGEEGRKEIVAKVLGIVKEFAVSSIAFCNFIVVTPESRRPESDLPSHWDRDEEQAPA